MMTCVERVHNVLTERSMRPPQAFRVRSRELHPDVASEDDRESAEAGIRALNEAYAAVRKLL